MNIVDEDKLELKTFSVRERNPKIIRHAKKAIFTMKHLDNMINIIIAEEYLYVKSKLSEDIIFEESDNVWQVFSLLLDPQIMKGVLSNNTGGQSTKDRIKIINDYYKNNQLMQSAKSLYEYLNDKNISELLKRIKTNWENYFTNKKKWFTEKEASGLTGCPQYPKPKKLKNVNQYSMQLSCDKFSLKRKNVLGLTFFKKQIQTRFLSNQYVNSKTIKSVNVSYSNGDIYYHFTYEVDKKLIKQNNKRKLRNIKQAGLDIGVLNLASIFVNDEDTQSIIISGNEFISKNCFYNKLLSNYQEKISKEAIKFREIIKQDGTKIEIPTEYTNQGKKLRKEKSKLIEKRKRYFDDKMNQYSKKILEYLQKNKVTDLVISKNLSFTKTTGEIKMNKKTKQKFYQIPFGKLLNMIEEKSPMHNIFVHKEDEGYTSKTSCLSSDVNKNQEKKSKNEPILPNDLNGNRGSKGKKLSRGLFRDTVLNVIINSDLNGAANHIRLAFDKVRITDLKNYLWKLQQPKKIKSVFEFNCFLSN